MKAINYLTAFLGIITCASLLSCERFLDEKPNQKLATPTTIQDLQALLNYYSYLNNAGGAASEVCADNYYLTRTDWQALSSDGYRRMYVWEKDFLFSDYPNDWSNMYRIVYFSNTVLDQWENATATTNEEKNDVKGQALFFRSKAFLDVAWLWCNAYDGHNDADLGIPLRLNPDFNEVSSRASLGETYNQIIADLREAAQLLPPRSIHPKRPSKAAAYAMLARTFLSMGAYDSAKHYADSCLAISHKLLDFNTLDESASVPIPIENEEVIFSSQTAPPAPLSPRRAKIDTILYAMYEENDLRKQAFFDKNADESHGFKGNFSGGPALFTGITVGEVYLIRAECLARYGDNAGAQNDLNTLLAARYRTDAILPDGQNDTAIDMLHSILDERRKELLMRGLRWMDLKRLNKGGSEIEIQRVLDGDRYTLAPNDLRYALPIPENVLEASKIEQNPR